MGISLSLWGLEGPFACGAVSLSWRLEGGSELPDADDDHGQEVDDSEELCDGSPTWSFSREFDASRVAGWRGFCGKWMSLGFGDWDHHTDNQLVLRWIRDLLRAASNGQKRWRKAGGFQQMLGNHSNCWLFRAVTQDDHMARCSEMATTVEAKSLGELRRTFQAHT